MIEANRLKHLNSTYVLSNGSKCRVVDYINTNKVTIETEEGYLLHCTMQNLKIGNVSSPMFPKLLNKGFIGIGKYSSKDKALYELWTSMMERAYCEKFHIRSPTYKDVEVCEEWLCFQNFAFWCDTQKFFNVRDNKGRSYCLDKDILKKGNKIYSPETCCFVPYDINNVVAKSTKIRGDYPIGVNYHKASGKFQVNMKCYGVQKYLGLYPTPEEAFNAYKQAKELYIKEVASIHRDSISSECYQALVNWKIEITD